MVRAKNSERHGRVIDRDGDEVGIGDDPDQLFVVEDRQAADLVSFEEQSGVAQAGVDVDGGNVRDHRILDADFNSVDAAFFVAQETVGSRQDIGQCYEPDELLAFYDRDMVNPVVMHQRSRLCQACRRWQRDQVGAHDGFDTEHRPSFIFPLSSLESSLTPGAGRTIARNTYPQFLRH